MSVDKNRIATVETGGDGRPHVLVFAGGDRPGVGDVAGLEVADLVVAADSGFDHAVALGFECDVLVGDLDSISETGLTAAVAAGVEIERHPVAKDRTDLALALEGAVGRGAARVTVVGGYGGRPDHFLANLAALTSPTLSGVEVEARLGDSWIRVVRHHTKIQAGVGEPVSILAVNQIARGVTTTGLRWELEQADVEPWVTLGMSNEVVNPPATVRLESGVLLVVEPAPPTT